MRTLIGCPNPPASAPSGRRTRALLSAARAALVTISIGFTPLDSLSGPDLRPGIPHPLLALGAPAAGASRATVVEVRGGSSDSRRLATDAAREWSRRGGGSAADLLSRVGEALCGGGFGDGEIEAAVDSLPDGSRRCRIDLRAVGRASLSEWKWEPPESGPAMKPGPWIPNEVDAKLWDAVEKTQEEGYPFASIQILEAGSDERGISVRARLRAGPALKLRSLVFDGRGATRQSYLERLSGLRIGEPIRPSRAGIARDRIERGGLFSRVDGPWLRTPDAGEASLVYRLVPAPQNRAEGAVGYDGSRRTLSGFVHLQIGNLFGTGRRLDMAWERYGRDRSRLNLAYREPYLLGLPLAAEAALSQEIEDSTWTVDDLRGVMEGDFGGGLTARLGLATHRTVQSGIPSARTSNILTIGGIGYDDRTDAGTRGGRSSLEVQRGNLRRSPRTSGGDGTLLRTLVLVERNQPVGGPGLLRLEFSGGWVQGPDSLPRPEAIGLGGSANLRGYQEQAFRVLRYGLVRIEGGVRVLPEGNRAYLFLDGAFYRPWPAGSTKRASSYGAGFRIRGGGGWVRLDYGIPAGEPPLSGRIHFRLETSF